MTPQHRQLQVRMRQLGDPASLRAVLVLNCMFLGTVGYRQSISIQEGRACLLAEPPTPRRAVVVIRSSRAVTMGEEVHTVEVRGLTVRPSTLYTDLFERFAVMALCRLLGRLCD